MTRQLSLSAAARRKFDVTGEEEFKKDVLLADKPVIVDFHAG